MNHAGISARKNFSQLKLSAALMAGTAMTMVAAPVHAQDEQASETADAEDSVIVVTGIRSSLASALEEKRSADSLVEIIQAEDIGKLPDQNLAEVLENVTGVQITRRGGVGVGVQIRGTSANRTEINGVGTIGSGTGNDFTGNPASGRGGISFEDVNAAIIAAVEVTKSPTADTIEGSVGGTINLRTIRPLDLTERLTTIRAQGEYSELSDSIKPRIAGSFGDRWDTGAGEIGIVIAGSYTQQEATSFRPRVDRDTLIEVGESVQAGTGAPGPDFDYLGIQFLNQELENFEYDTINIAGSIEWAPSDNLKLFFDGFYNDQERRQDSSRIQASGVSSLRDHNVPATFETVNFGSLGGVNLGTIQAALTGFIEPDIADDDDDPNLRFSSDTGARLTESTLFRIGGEYETGRLSARVEASRTSAKTSQPQLDTTLNFINPNPLALDPFLAGNGSNDNAVPFVYDLTGGALAFGINFDSPFAPTVADLTDLSGANVVLDAVTASNNRTENDEIAGRIDLSLDLEDIGDFITSFDWGYRYNRLESDFTRLRSTFSTGNLDNSPFGTTFSDLLAVGPNNFGDADGRTLAIRNFITINPNLAFNDRQGTFNALQAALDATPGGMAAIANGGRLLSDLDPNDAGNVAASFSINETTHAVYGQANFDFGQVRGNVGLRYVSSRVNSIGNQIANGVVSQVTTSGNYDQILPRVNLVADLTDNLALRASWTEDINRPNFNALSTSISFPTGPNNAVVIGNPDLQPETVTSFDASLSWYFAPSSVISVGFFHKTRTNLFQTLTEAAVEDANGFRDITDPCEGGGIFNPVPDRNVLSDVPGNGLCVPINTTVNDPGETTQTGIEIAFQYDLSQFEDALGFASGFGVIANYTYQKFGGGLIQDTSDADSRGTEILESSSGLAGPFTATRGLLDFSPHAYNVTLYYEKYGISARARYTWRDAFRTLDTAAGASLGSTIGFPIVTEARGQLNASITYDVTDYLNIGVEGVNLLKSDITQSCINSGALFCNQGLPDRRLTFGATMSF
ncbi:TonB-dependent receptor [Parasphingorhabdus marina DSM 22363]|uniref:TonB-dependent receptor n=1 Tax=Parasphingorhabdus marina DSM 22363 TaxID=1123272 RepID=A0A1N6EH27_9SPHN|nr:TonB-dependent receptor [Parasphingorhabdus marina]SIN82343.1 TonB-dependent receptor [Parasphingorhabdus marina DSM 22363]